MPAELQSSAVDFERGIENAPRADPEAAGKQYRRQPKDLQ
jgi:hypothetical protein